MDISINLNININELDKNINDPVLLKMRTYGAIDSLKRIYTTLAESAAYRATSDPDWSLLAGRIEILRLMMLVPETLEQVYEKCNKVYQKDYLDFCKTHWKQLEDIIVKERDFDFHYFGVKTLEKSYLLKADNEYLETPQRMYLRVASYLWMPDIDAIKEYYNLISQGYFTHASPTLFNAGINKGNLASCFLLSVQDDLSKIFDCLSKCAQISKSAGGIGLDVSSIRHSKIGHYGDSSGIVPMLKVYDAAMKYVDQCFSPETMIYTKTGYKKIVDIVPGDKVINSTGNFSKISKIIHYPFTPDLEIFAIKLITNIEEILVVGRHPILAIKGGLKNKVDDIKTGLVKPEYIQVSQLEKGDLVVVPKFKYNLDIPDYTNESLKIYAKLIMRGRFQDNTFELDTMDINEFNQLKTYLRFKNISFNIIISKNTRTIKWKTGSGFPFTQNIINNPFTHDILNLPKEKLKIIIDELFGNNSNIIEISLKPNMLYGLNTILYKINLLFAVKKLENDLYRFVKMYTNETDDFYFIPVDSNSIVTDYKFQSVIELEMFDQNNPNYLTPIGLAHNGGRRKGSATIFLNPFHIDILDFIALKRAQGVEERRARDLFYSCWIPDIFMERVKNNEMWSLFCPKKAPLLTQTYGNDFELVYKKYEQLKLYEKQMPARLIWNELLDTQIETGMPFMTYCDTANATSNQKNLGLLRSSNLCQEIIEITGPSVDSRKTFKQLTGEDIKNWWPDNPDDRISSCNLASIALDEYVSIDNKTFNFELLGQHVRKIVQGLNRVIDKTSYPLCTLDNQGNILDGPIKTTNLKYRPLGIGVQGLADVFYKMDYAWSDDSAKQLNNDIFATIYYYALDESVEQAKVYGYYTSFENSPSSKGFLKFDLIADEIFRKWNKYGFETAITKKSQIYTKVSQMYNWNSLKEKIKLCGLRNSLLVALMPTASTAQIRYKTEAFEPMTSNIYIRSVLSGNHIFINRHLVKRLKQINLWTPQTINLIISNNGSIQNISYIPNRLKEIYKTAFELKQKILVDMAIDRSLYVCQSQSLNVFIENANYSNLTSLHFYGWENCLTTGMYYLRTTPSTEAVKFTVDTDFTIKSNNNPTKTTICTDEVCVMCSS